MKEGAKQKSEVHPYSSVLYDRARQKMWISNTKVHLVQFCMTGWNVDIKHSTGEDARMTDVELIWSRSLFSFLLPMVMLFKQQMETKNMNKNRQLGCKSFDIKFTKNPEYPEKLIDLWITRKHRLLGHLQEHIYRLYRLPR